MFQKYPNEQRTLGCLTFQPSNLPYQKAVVGFPRLHALKQTRGCELSSANLPARQMKWRGTWLMDPAVDSAGQGWRSSRCWECWELHPGTWGAVGFRREVHARGCSCMFTVEDVGIIIDFGCGCGCLQHQVGGVYCLA